jgi:hypothetical protein
LNIIEKPSWFIPIIQQMFTGMGTKEGFEDLKGEQLIMVSHRKV